MEMDCIHHFSEKTNVCISPEALGGTMRTMDAQIAGDCQKPGGGQGQILPHCPRRSQP